MYMHDECTRGRFYSTLSGLEIPHLINPRVAPVAINI